MAGGVCRHALSGGRQTVEEHRRLGADLAVDVPFKWLRFFLDDDARYAEIERDYGSGAMLTGEVKQQLVSVLQVCRCRRCCMHGCACVVNKPQERAPLYGRAPQSIWPGIAAAAAACMAMGVQSLS